MEPKDKNEYNIIVEPNGRSANGNYKLKLHTILRYNDSLMNLVQDVAGVIGCYNNTGDIVYDVYVGKQYKLVEAIRHIIRRVAALYSKMNLETRIKPMRFEDGKHIHSEEQAQPFIKSFQGEQLAVMHEKCERTAVICRGSESERMIKQQISEGKKMIRRFETSAITYPPKVENCEVLPAPEEGEIKGISVMKKALDHAETCSKAIHGTDAEKDIAISKLLFEQLQRSAGEVADVLHNFQRATRTGEHIGDGSKAFRDLCVATTKLDELAGREV